MKIGFMQGRLVDSEKKNTLQFFPSKQWKDEIFLANEIDLNIMEWTINYENIEQNHLFNFKKNKELKKIIQTNEIKIPSVTCDFFMQIPFFKKADHRKCIKDLKQVIKLSNNIGIKFIVLPLVDLSSIENLSQEKSLIKEMKKISKLLGKKIFQFIEKLNHKFGINYDTGNSASLGFDFIEEKKYFKYVKNIHIKDRTFRGNSVRLGKGDFDFKSFFKFLKKIRYKGNLILQTARAKNHIQEIKKNKRFIEKFL
jgi:hexulose-6-phosphate isomerase